MPATITRREVQALYHQGARLVEVLPREEYETAHLPGAINIPLKELNGRAIAGLGRDDPIIVYCNDMQ
jgi:rhodanese-related sulfurtransferase